MIDRDDLRRIRLFQGFSDPELDMVRVVAEEGIFEDGRLIIREGSPGERLYMIASGKVSITTEIAGAGTEEIKLMEAGDFFGEMSLLESLSVSASAFARGTCRLLWIDRKSFDRLIAEDMPIANKLLKAIILTFCERSRDTARKIESYYRMSKF